QSLERHAGADMDSVFLLVQASQFRYAGNVDLIPWLLVLIDAGGSIAEDELDLLPACQSDKLFLEPLDLCERAGPVPFATAAAEVQRPRRLAEGRKHIQVNASEFAPVFDRETRINQAFLGMVLDGIVVPGKCPYRVKDRTISGAAT